MRLGQRHRGHRHGHGRHAGFDPTAGTLAAARRGDAVEIMGVDDPGARVNALRFGMSEGARVTCVTVIPAGPVVIQSGRQEIAIGRGLARRIRVRTLEQPNAGAERS